MERAIFSPVSLLEVTCLSDVPTWNQSYKQLGWLRQSSGSSNEITKEEANPAWGECLSLLLDDITTLEVNFIVNPSNRQFSAGGGLNGVIHSLLNRVHIGTKAFAIFCWQCRNLFHLF